MAFWCDRRTFLRNCALWAIAISARVNFVRGQEPSLKGGGGSEGYTERMPLERGFLAPPDWAKPWVYWWWRDGYVTREGILRDLDEMKLQGISGVLVFNADGGPTPKSTAFMSREWRDRFRFAVQEASKRDIEVSLNLCSGWDAGGPWITAEEAPQTLVFSKLRMRGPRTFTGLVQEPKHNDPYYRDVVVLAYQLETGNGTATDSSLRSSASNSTSVHYLGVPIAGPAEKHLSICRSESVKDLSNRMDRNGQLTWQVPEGDWLILRFGHTVEMPATHAYIKCCGPKDEGYEIDPLRPDTMDKQFAATAGKVMQDVKPWIGKTLKHFHIDSWEIGKPNWTPEFRADFRHRRGYDLLPYLAALAGETIDNREVTARFIEDFNMTLGDLTVDNYYGKLADLSHRYGVSVHPESEGYQKPCEDSLKALGRSDIMMGEYWSRITQPDGYIHQRTPAQLRWADSIKGASSAAHIYDRNIVQGEAFTCTGAVDWSEYPFALKDIGDRAFCAGLNRNVLHNCMHQPDLHAVPGYVWPGVGMKADRNVTWWPMSHAWLRYLSRCQFLFRRGRFVADVCYFYGEEAPNYVPAKDSMIPPLPKGFDCDSINAEALLSRMTVKDGRLCLPQGINYRILVMPYRPYSMPPPNIFISDQNAYPGPGNGLPVGVSANILRKVKELVESGATVLGPKPVRAPGLSEYPHSDEEIAKLADELWGDTKGEPSGQRNVGQGRVIWGRSIEEILEGDGVSADFKFCSDQRATDLDYIHYTSDTTEIYFISNQNLRSERVECRFRVSGRQPELWDPVTGAIRDLPEFEEEHGQTVIPLEFAPRQSFFVMFRRTSQIATSQGKRRKNFPGIETMQEISGPWQVSFDPKWGGPEKVTFDKLEDWTERPEEGIRYYSGTATYGKTFDLPAKAKGSRLFLDLGVVNYMAAVRLNGKDLGVVWTAPWRVEITEAVRLEGNSLEIDTVNLWTNRVIGDAKLPPEKRFMKTNVVPNPAWQLFASGLLGPVTVRKEI